MKKNYSELFPYLSEPVQCVLYRPFERLVGDLISQNIKYHKYKQINEGRKQMLPAPDEGERIECFLVPFPCSSAVKISGKSSLFKSTVESLPSLLLKLLRDDL